MNGSFFQKKVFSLSFLSPLFVSYFKIKTFAFVYNKLRLLAENRGKVKGTKR